MSNIDEILKKQRDFFASGATIPLNFRKDMLKRLYDAINKNRDAICGALKCDLGKSDYESFMCEIGMTLSEISYMLKNLKKLAKEKRVKTPISQFVSKSYTKPAPFGNVLIVSPWNYPLLLTLSPLADALAAGNTAILKPSAYSPAVSDAIEALIKECFDEEYVAVIKGGRRENAMLLEKKFDLIFFTGSTAVGREVLRHAAENLTPCVLELGGKSPCIVDESAKIPLTARRIVFGKYLNCGQTCVAPDYILCQEGIKDALISAIKKEITLQFGESPLENPDYGKIVNEKHFDRIISLIEADKTVIGGENRRDALKIAPTVMDDINWDSPVMGEEIFGPVLPIMTYKCLDDVVEALKDRPKPLALYMFSENKENIKTVTERIRFGGGCINDTVVHLATSNMPFGGVGESGMGSYHGRDGFNTFSHTKSILDKKTWMDLNVRYQPYDKEKNIKLLRRLMK